ncbi:MAG: metallophosphoesterase, partial [Pyrobaculum sp.]
MEGVDRIIDLLAKVRERASSLVLQIQGRYLAVGDLHGDIDTLEKILAEWEAPYLFLGDYVDRGDRGLEVVTKVFELMLDGKAVV